MYIERLKQMFADVTLKKDASAIPAYYSDDFLLYTNGQVMGYAEFVKVHHEVFATSIQYDIRYDEPTFVEHGEKVAGRVWITTQMPDESPRELEVILIAQFKDNKLYRLWELTYPDWSQMPVFNEK